VDGNVYIFGRLESVFRSSFVRLVIVPGVDSCVKADGNPREKRKVFDAIMYGASFLQPRSYDVPSKEIDEFMVDDKGERCEVVSSSVIFLAPS